MLFVQRKFRLVSAICYMSLLIVSGLPGYIEVLGGFSNLSTLVSRFVSNDGGCLNAFLSTSLLLSTPNIFLRE